MACGDACPLLSQILSGKKTFDLRGFWSPLRPNAKGLSQVVQWNVPLSSSILVAWGRKVDFGRDEIPNA